MKKFKKVILIWLIVYLLITLLLVIGEQWIVQLPVYVRTLVLSLVMVFGLQYLVLPKLDKIQSFFYTQNSSK